MHEIGHVLGFDSNTGLRELSRNAPVAVTIRDIFRFRPGATLDSFATAQRVLCEPLASKIGVTDDKNRFRESQDSNYRPRAKLYRRVDNDLKR
ncbi:MAG TPA: hypothetical protein VF747_04015 [Blastocatellia bacterium]